MTPTQPLHRIDRIVDFLIDRQHPFWKDERQASIFNEASSAALNLQSLLLPLVGSICLLIKGRPAIGVVTAMVLTGSAGQWLVFGVLTRRHVEVDLKGWTRSTSRPRRLMGVAVILLYLASLAWAWARGEDFSRPDMSTSIGFGGGIFLSLAVAAAGYAVINRKIKQRNATTTDNERT